MEGNINGNINKKSNGAMSKLGIALLVIIIVFVLYFAIYLPSQAEEVTYNTETAFMLMAICIVIGEVVSTKTKAFVPSMFISAVLFVLGFWTFFPAGILQQGGVAPNLPTFLVMMMVVHLGTMMDFQELAAQWKSVIITLMGMLGIMVVILTLGASLLGWETAAIAAPPLTGGFVAALMMQQAAGDNTHLYVLAMAVYVLQGFVGYPLTSISLKKESKRLIELYRKGEIDTTINSNVEKKNNDKKLFERIPAQYRTNTFILMQMAVLVVFSGYLEKLSGGNISKFVWALFVGVLAGETGLIETKPLETSKSMGYVYTIIMMFVFAGLNSITPDTLGKLISEFALLILLSVTGIAIFSIPVGKKLGLSIPMSFALGLGSIAGGFPASYVLSVEAARVTAKNEEEYKVLESHLLPKTLVAGFVSATLGSVIIAGIMIKMVF